MTRREISAHATYITQHSTLRSLPWQKVFQPFLYDESMDWDAEADFEEYEERIDELTDDMAKDRLTGVLESIRAIAYATRTPNEKDSLEPIFGKVMADLDEALKVR